MADYWKDCVEEAFDDAKLSATPDQIDIVISWVEGAHENYSMAMGHDVATRNYHAEKEAQRQKLEKELELEKSKRGCPECRGRGYFIVNYGTRSGEETCHRCNGEGKIL